MQFNNNIFSFFFFGVCRPLRPSCYTSNYPAFPIQSSYFPIRSSIQCQHIFIFIISFHLNRGLPSGRLPTGFSPIIILITLFWLHLACPAHWSLRFLIVFTMFYFLNRLSNSLFFLILHSPVSLSFAGPKIFLRIFLSKTIGFLSSFFLNGQVSAP
jgi:hypothetical protein